MKEIISSTSRGGRGRGGNGRGGNNNNNNDFGRGGGRGRGGNDSGAGRGRGGKDLRFSQINVPRPEFTTGTTTGSTRGGRGGNNNQKPSTLDRFAKKVQVDRRGRPIQQQQQSNNNNKKDPRLGTLKTQGGLLHLHQKQQQPQINDDDEFDDEEDDEEMMDFDDEGNPDWDDAVEEEDDDDEMMDEQELQELEDEVHWADENIADEIEYSDATHRIAVVNIDWDNIRTEDLFSLFSHTLPVGGKLLSVTKYLSDFGKENIEYEKKHGPDLWVKKGEEGYEEEKKLRAKNKDSIDQEAAEMKPSTRKAIKGEAARLASFFTDDNEDEDEDEEKFKSTNAKVEEGGADFGGDDDEEEIDEDELDAAALIAGEEEDEEVFSSGKHRQYELNRMKYYYCIAEFDSVDTAQVVYNTCDGVDVEASGVVLDLRYVPEDETFDESRIQGRPITKLPRNYTHMKSFKNAALTQTRFKISWDRDDALRTRSFQDSFTEDTDAANLKAYMATTSSDEDSDDDDEGISKRKRLEKRAEIRRKYAALLSNLGVDPEALPAEDDDDEGEYDDQNKNNKKGSKNKSDIEKNVESDSEDDDDFDEEVDDDDLNADVLRRFADEEDEEDGDDHMEEEFGDDSEDSDDRFKEMTSTMDVDVEDKAQRLQRDLQNKAALSKATLGELQAQKYKEKRKQMKKEKMNAIIAARAEADAPLSAEDQEKEKTQLRSALGDVLMAPKDPNALKGKRKVKAHAKEKRLLEQQQRQELKQKRILQELGVKSDAAIKNRAVQQNQKSASATTTTTTHSELQDDRFKKRLIADPRYHVDPNADHHKTGQKHENAARLAVAVQRERAQKGMAISTAQLQQQQRQQQQQQQQAAKQQEASSKKSAVEDDAFKFFESQKSKFSSGQRRQRE